MALFWLDLEAYIIPLDDICNNNVILFLNLLLLCSYSSGLYPPVSAGILRCCANGWLSLVDAELNGTITFFTCAFV